VDAALPGWRGAVTGGVVGAVAGGTKAEEVLRAALG